MRKYIKYISLFLTFILIASCGMNICANSMCKDLGLCVYNSWGAHLDGKCDRIYFSDSLCFLKGFELSDRVGSLGVACDKDSLYVFVSLDCKLANLSSEQCEKSVTVAIDWEDKGESASYYTVSYPEACLNATDFEYVIFDGDDEFNVEYKIPLQSHNDVGFYVEAKYINADGESVSATILNSVEIFDISAPQYFDYICLNSFSEMDDSYFLDVSGTFFGGVIGAEYPWYYRSVKYCFRNSLMVGVDDNYFAPDAEMSRAMFAQVLYNMEKKPDVSAYENKFTDVNEEDWFYDAVVWASNNGVVTGTDDTTFSPDEPVTREQLSAMVYRYANAKNYDMTASADISTFQDSAEASSYAEDALKWSVGAGLISGNKINGETMLDPKGNATRAQVATILERFCEKVAK